jgi:hypothetical protein
MKTMKNLSKRTQYYIIGGMGLVMLIILLSSYLNNRIVTPEVGKDGEINGNYTIAGIMKLDTPYVCTFEKSDGVSNISGIVHTDGHKIYEEFKIKTDLVKNGFNSFLLIKDSNAYTWTSLQNTGYISPVAESASKNASPKEQAQIIGTKDKVLYSCKPWLNPNSSIFETPVSIMFSGLKK